MTHEKIQPAVSTTFQPGAILEDSWGWEQTNIDFYCIVSRTGDFVSLLPMKKNTGPELGFQSMANKVTPTEIDWSAKPIKKKIKKSRMPEQLGKEIGFTLRNYTGGGWCDLWKGQPSTETHYA